MAVKPEPVVFIHGGRGARFAPFDSDAYGSLDADGFRVYLYDQAGSGASSLLPHIRDYSIMEVTRFGKTLVCKGDSAKTPALIAGVKNQPDNPGFKGYVSALLLEEAATAQADPRVALRGNQTPAILLYGDCNYLAWQGSVEYRKTFANLKIFYVPHAGHYIQFEQPELMSRVIRSFLLNQPDAIPPYTGDADPRLAAK